MYIFVRPLYAEVFFCSWQCVSGCFKMEAYSICYVSSFAILFLCIFSLFHLFFPSTFPFYPSCPYHVFRPPWLHPQSGGRVPRMCRRTPHHPTTCVCKEEPGDRRLTARWVCETVPWEGVYGWRRKEGGSTRRQCVCGNCMSVFELEALGVYEGNCAHPAPGPYRRWRKG